MKEKNGKLGLGILIGILICLIIGLIGFLIYSKVIDEDKETVAENQTMNNNSTEDNMGGSKDQTSFDLSKVDFNKPAINGNTGEVFELLDNSIDYMSIRLTDNNSVIISIHNSYFSTYFPSLNIADSVKEYEVNNFSKTVKKVYLFPRYSSGGNEVALYLMDDGTVQYTMIYSSITDNPNATNFKSMGPISDVSDIEEIVIASKSNIETPAALYMPSLLAVKGDGTFYEIQDLMKN